MSPLWFVGFSLVWTGLLCGTAHLLCRDPVPARFAHTVWRGAAVFAVLPWALVGIFLFLPELWDTPIPDLPYVESAATVLSETLPIETVTDSPTLTWVSTLLGIALLLGWAARLTMNLICQVRLQRIKASATHEARLVASHWSEKLGLSEAPKIARISNGSPFLAGIRQRRIYLPTAISTQADADIIMAHECTHIARGDLQTRPFERLIADIFWFSPFAWIMRRQLDYWREAACDEQTAELTGDGVAYARSLAHTARLVRPQPTRTLPVAAFILPQPQTLKRRLNQLLGHRPEQPRRGLAILAVVFGLVLAPLALAQSASFSGSTLYTHALLHSGKISSPYGDIVDPFSNQRSWHAGVDIKAKLGAPIYAPAAGKIIYTGKKDGYGYTVDMKLEDGTKLRFAQLQKMAVKKGDWVEGGKMVGKVGSSGRSTGAHLHFEVWRDDKMWDPEKESGLILVKS